MFSWSTGRQRNNGQNATTTTDFASSSSYPGNRATNSVATAIRGSIRPPEYSRKQHLDSYIENDVLRRSTRRVSSDDSTYDTVFQTVAGNTLILRVHLPTDASRSPVMTLAGCQATHPWIDYQMKVVGYKPIQSDQQWRDSRMLLGVAVQEVVQHFQVQPPAVQQIIDAGLRNIQSANSSTPPRNSTSTRASHQSRNNNQQQQQPNDDAPPDYETLLQNQSSTPPPPQHPPPQVDLPSVPAEFSKLESMEREVLEKLLRDHVALVAFCNELPFCKELNEKKMSVLEENITKAEENMEKQGELQKLHTEVKELQKRLKSRVAEFQELEKKQDSLCAVPDTRTVVKELHVAKKEAFDESEQLAEEWLDEGAQDIKGFCHRFIEARKIHHLRAGKMEILQQQQDGSC